MKVIDFQDFNNRLSNIKDERKKKILSSILKDDTWFLKVKFDTAISILMDLDYSKEEAIKIYKALIMG